MKLTTLLISIFVCSSTIAQKDNIEGELSGLERFYFTLGLGLSHNLYHNNEFSKEMSSIAADNADFSINYYLTEDKRNAIGFCIGSYDHYSQQSKEKLIELLNDFGVDRYGDIVFNDWAEWHLGMSYSRLLNIKERFFFTASAGPSMILASRSKNVHKTDGDDFVYAHVPKMQIGFSGIVDLGVYCRLKLGYGTSIGVVYDLNYGIYPANYDVRFGNGDATTNDFDYYNYTEDFMIFRQRVRLSLKFDLADFM